MINNTNNTKPLIEGTLRKQKDGMLGGYHNRYFKVYPKGKLFYAKVNYDKGSLQNSKAFENNAKEFDLNLCERRISSKDKT